ncbi:MAG: TonB family protein [Pseudomonadales bacterium]|nr:TonB family protein [Pseudomonadales bacterium]
MLQLVRDFSVPVALTLLLHAALAYLLHEGWGLGLEESRAVIEPNTLKTRLVMLAWDDRSEPEPIMPSQPTLPTRSLEPQSAPDPQPEASAQPEAPPQETPEEARARREAERQARLQELAQEAFNEAIESECIELSMEAAGDAASTYQNLIYSQIVANWSRPPSARNFMSATLQVELFPNGDLNVVTLLESSGDTAFDRSALQAVRKVSRFKVPEDTTLFEGRFRKFRLVFRPEDLLR